MLSNHRHVDSFLRRCQNVNPEAVNGRPHPRRRPSEVMTQATPTKEKQNKLNKHTHELDYILFGFYFLFNGRGDITQGFRES